jgi:hypothetical protein
MVWMSHHLLMLKEQSHPHLQVTVGLLFFLRQFAPLKDVCVASCGETRRRHG